MSKPILFHAPLSPPSRTAFITANEVGLDFELRIIDFLKLDNRGKEFLKVNPLGKVPALLDGDFNLDDSHAIAIYLVEKFAKDDSLYPKDLQFRTRVNQRLFFDASYLWLKLLEVIMPLYMGVHKEVPEAKVTEVQAAYKILDGFFETGNSYIAGDSYTIADISIWSTLASMRLLVPIDETKFSRLTSWLDLLNSRSTAEINNNGAREHMAFVKKFNDKEIDFADLIKKFKDNNLD